MLNSGASRKNVYGAWSSVTFIPALEPNFQTESLFRSEKILDFANARHH